MHGLHWKTLLLYLEDIIVIAPDFPTHLLRLREVLQRLRGAGLKLKPGKCELFQSQVRYLGHIVSAKGIATDPEKISAVGDWPPPHNLKQLQAFLGTVGYYRQYIPDFATIAKPLTAMTGKEVRWEWNEDTQLAFNRLKGTLTRAPILGYPEPRLNYILDTDASTVGVGGVLSQIQDGQERVIAYFSKTLGGAEQNYCVTRRELLAVIKSVQHFRPYLYGRPFHLRTDHASLLWLSRRREPAHQVARWLEILAEFRYTLEHRIGAKHGNVDGLSRRNCIDCRQCQRIEERDGGPTRAQVDQELEVMSEDRVSQVGELGRQQQTGTGPVAQMYAVIQESTEMTREELQNGTPELRKLYQQKGAMRIRSDGTLEIRVSPQQKPRWCAICPPALRSATLWNTHRMTHSGMSRTLGRVRLTWY